LNWPHEQNLFGLSLVMDGMKKMMGISKEIAPGVRA